MSELSLYAPICNNHAFLPIKLDPVFVQWQRAGLGKFIYLYIDGTFAKFDTLSTKFNLQSSNFFRYLQIHFVRAISLSFPNLPPKKEMELVLQTPPHHRGLISHI